MQMHPHPLLHLAAFNLNSSNSLTPSLAGHKQTLHAVQHEAPKELSGVNLWKAGKWGGVAQQLWGGSKAC